MLLWYRDVREVDPFSSVSAFGPEESDFALLDQTRGINYC
jgi:hypothetical protein